MSGLAREAEERASAPRVPSAAAPPKTLDSLIAELSGARDKHAAQWAITAYLRGKVTSDREDWLNDYRDYSNKENCPLPIEGDQCVDLLGKCLDSSKQSECRAAWAGLNFSGGIDANKMDLATARNLVSKMGITGTVDEWIKANSLTLQPTVANALRVIVSRVRNPSGLAGSKRSEVPMVVASALVPFSLTPRVAFTSMSGVMVGGGGNRAAANFIQMSNYLKNRYTLVGGASNAVPSSVAALRSSLAELDSALKSKGKAIEETDKQRIVQLIDSLQSTEQKAEKAAKYMSELRRLLAHPKYDTIVASTVANEVTADMMRELTENHKTLLAASSKKSYNLLSILETVAGLVDDVKAIKAVAVRPAAV
jgi:hypothetical protein